MPKTIDQMVADANKAYQESEVRTGQWIPPDGTYSAVINGFDSRVATWRETNEEYCIWKILFLISDGEFKDRETGQTMNNRVYKFKDSREVFFGLQVLKTMAMVLNDGTIDEDLASSLALLEASAQNKQPVQIQIKTRKNKDPNATERYADITILAVGS